MSDTTPALRYVQTTQADGRLLLRFVARRSDRTLDGAAAQPDKLDCAVLFEPAETVAADPARVAVAVACVDALGVRAAPANVRSIRLTTTYLGIGEEDGEPPPGIKDEVRRIRRYMFLVGTLAVLLLGTCVGLLAHMDAGRRLLTQVNELRAQEDAVRRDIATLALPESAPVGLLPGQKGAEPTVQLLTDAVAQRVAAALGLTAEQVRKLGDAAPLCGRPLELAGAKWLDDAATPDLLRYPLTLWREPASAKAAAI
jgi:hypothetical protein